ncbi:MAG: hypothetical protein ABI878_09535 [Acidobacteriota bacterium]
MKGKTKPINVEELNKIEIKMDGKNGERFEVFTRRIISVPKVEIDRREAAEKKAKETKAT